MNKLESRGLKSAVELGRNKPHGTRVKYMGGCRCLPCRAANSKYSCECEARVKRGETNRIVSAELARKHILDLRSAGIGRDPISEISGVATSIICGIASGSRTHCRENTERAISRVTKEARCGNTVISAKKMNRRIAALLREGFTPQELAKRLGYKSRHLQIGKKPHCLAETEMRVERLYRLLMEDWSNTIILPPSRYTLRNLRRAA